MSIGSNVSRVENDESGQEEQYQQYMNDWFVHLDNSNNTSITYGSVVHKEVSDVNINHQSFEPIDGPMDSAWPMQSHDIYHTGLSPYNTANNPGAEKWRFKSDYGAIEQSSAVIDTNGIIYFGTKGAGSLFALYQNGSKKWKYDVQPGTQVWSTPAIAEDGTIYVGTWGGGYLYAVNPDGTQKWAICLIPYTNIDSSIIIGNDNTIYFGCENNRVYAMNPNGTERWHYSTGGFIASCPAIGNNNMIYVGSGDGYLYGLYPNGTLNWRFETGGWIKGNPTIAHDGIIYVPSFDGYLYALYPNGTMKWRASTGSSVAGAGVALANDETIYIGTELLRAYYPNGTLKWASDVHGSIYGTTPAVSSDGTIFVSAGLDLVAVNPNGTERWRTTIAGTSAYSSPCISEDGAIYVGSTWYQNHMPYGHLIAIGSGEPKKIEIQQPGPSKLYLFGLGIGNTLLGNTVIIGSVNVKVRVYSEDQIESLHFYVDGSDQYSVTAPPFEWNMNQRYGKLFPLTHTITVTAFYKGGCQWSESIAVLYFHLL